MDQADILTKERIIIALNALNERLTEKGVTGEVCIFGGATMILAFDARQSTRDVDAVFVPKTEIYQAAEQIADEMNLPISWLNDGVKGFISSEGELTTDGMPQWENLRILRPITSYLLAMKCMAARVAEYDTVGDKGDIKHLCNNLGLKTSQEVLNIVGRYYPPARIHVKTKYFIEEALEEMKGENE